MRSLPWASVVAIGLAGAVLPAHAGGARLVVRHDVTDYSAWRKVYDGFDATRKKMGVTGQAVDRMADNPNDVIVTHDFKTMEKAGVSGAPQIWFTKRAMK